MTKNGFTLAEVLITLGVIGVVSALTMPTLIQNYQKQATVTQLKKAYSEFAQAIQKAEAEHGLMETWNFKDFETSNERNKYFGENYIFPYIKTVKTCIPTSNGCWADDIKNLGDNKLTAYFTNNMPQMVSFVTASGYTVYYWLHGTGTGMWYVVDVNGLKEPNKLGRDIFAFTVNWVVNKKFIPAGANYTKEEILSGEIKVPSEDKNAGNLQQYACTKDNSGSISGAFCGALIMHDGWKIEKDYPW